MSNPFEEADQPFHVLANDEGQHSLWPAPIPVPDGWAVVARARSRAECLEYVGREWTDMRPRSLAAAQER